MAYKIGYLFPQRILATYLYDTLAEADFLALAQDSYQMMETGDAPVHTLSLIDPGVKYPRDLKSIAAMIKSAGTPHPKVGWVVQVSDHTLHRFVGSWSVQLVVKNIRYHAVTDLTAALHFLKDRDVTLAGVDVATVRNTYAAWKPVP